MKTLQNQYKLILEGKGNKEVFIKQARRQFPQLFNQYTTFNTAVKVLKGKQILTEETKETKEWDPLKDMPFIYDFKNNKAKDNINFSEILKGFYCEMRDIDNLTKTVDELVKITTDNLAKDPLYYVKNGEFGIKGVGYTDDAVAYGKPKEIKGKWKSSGMEEVPLKENKQSLKKLLLESFPDDWDSMDHPNYPEGETHKYGLFKTEEDGSWNDGGGNVNTGMINSSDNIEDLIVTAKEEYMNENNIEFDDIPLDKNGLPPGYHIDELAHIMEAWDTSGQGYGEEYGEPSYKIKILDIKDVQKVQSIIQDLGIDLPIFGYSDVFEIIDLEDHEAVIDALTSQGIDFEVQDGNDTISETSLMNILDRPVRTGPKSGENPKLTKAKKEIDKVASILPYVNKAYKGQLDLKTLKAKILSLNLFDDGYEDAWKEFIDRNIDVENNSLGLRKGSSGSFYTALTDIDHYLEELSDEEQEELRNYAASKYK
jgi:hypothetical protein